MNGITAFPMLLPLPFAGITQTGSEGLPASLVKEQGLSAQVSSPSTLTLILTKES